MSIELKQAAEKALEALEFSETSPHRPQYEIEAKAMRALRTAIQQAEVQQPATGEPVGYMNAGNIHELKQGALPYGYVYPQKESGVSVPVYAHTAPSVPEAVARDAERYRFILAAADDMKTSRYQSLCELLGVAITEDFDLGAAIDAATTSTQQPKEPS